MNRKDFIQILREIDDHFLIASSEAGKEKDPFNASYVNGYQTCCDDIHYFILKKINRFDQTLD